MAGAAVPIGAVASIGGLNAFLGGLTQVGNQFGVLSQQSAAVVAPLAQATAGFAQFNQATAAVGQTLGAVGQAFATATAPVRALGSAMGSVFDQLASVAGTSSSAVVASLGAMGVAAAALGVGGTAGLAAFIAGLTAVTAAAIGVTAQFQREVVDLGAITQESPQAVAALTETVKSLARQFATSIPDIQGAGLELTRAGVPIEVAAGGALRLTLALEQLSKGEISAGKAAEGLGSIMTVFRTSLDEAGDVTVAGAARVANSITAIANATRAGIPEVVTAFAKVGPEAAKMGETVETTAAALGLLLKAGLQGEEAGTALRNFFQRLSGPANEARDVMQEFGISLFDANGNTRAYSSVLADLVEVFDPTVRATKGISDATLNWGLQTIFMTRTLTAATLAAQQGTAQYDAFLEVIRQTSVLEQAAQQMDSLLRQISRFRNVVELGAISFGTNFVDGLSAATRSIVDFLVEGERLERLTGAIGAGARGILTGGGAQPGSAEQTQVADQFGAGAAETLALVTQEFQRVSAAAGETLGAAGRLKDDLLRIVFPRGIDDLISRIGNALVEVNVIAQGFLEFIRQIAPNVAVGFGNAVEGVQRFVDELKKIVTGGVDAQQVASIFDQIGTTAQNVAGIIGDVVLAMGRFVRAVVDNAGPILGVFEAVSRAIGFITIGFINLATTAVQVFGAIGRAMDNQAVRIGQRIATVIGLGVGARAGHIPSPDELAKIRESLTAPLDAPTNDTSDLERVTATLGETFRTSTADAQAFFQSLNLGEGFAADLFESVVTGTSVIQRQIVALEDLQSVVAEGGDLGQFLGDRRLPVEIRDSIAEIVELLSGAESEIGDPFGLTVRQAERLNTVLDFVAAQAGVTKEALIAADLASDLSTRRGAGSTLGPGQFDPEEARRAAKKAGDDLRRAQDRATEAQEDAVRNIATAERQLTNATESIVQRMTDGLTGLLQQFRDAQEKIASDLDRTLGRMDAQFAKSRQRQDEDIVRGRADEDARTAFDRTLEDERNQRQQAAEDRETLASRLSSRILDIEQRNQEDITRIRQRGIEDSNRVFQRGQEDALRILTDANEKATQELSRQFDVTNTNRGRGREDVKRQRQLTRDLARADTEEEKADIRARFDEESTALKERRGEEDQDRQIRLQQEEQLQTLRKTQEAAVLQFRRAQEDLAVARRREQEVADIQFRLGLEQSFLLFRESLEDQSRARQREAQKQELAINRAEQARSVQFGRNQATALRDEVTIPRADEDFAEQRADVIQRAVEQFQEALKTLFRGVTAQQRTANRELDAADRSFIERGEQIIQRLHDQQSDVIRGTREQREELTRLLAIAPPGIETERIEASLAQLRSIEGLSGGVIAQVQAAQIVSQGFARAELAAIRERLGARAEEKVEVGELLQELESIQRLGGLDLFQPGTERDSVDGILREFESFQSGQRSIEIRSFVTSPQADTMIALLRQIAVNTGTPADQAPLIGEINLAPTTEAAQEVGNAVASAVRFVGGNA